jgi:phenylpropionate dioxygenase-like ring-hydroxylating dioxygenase large terminal subunit
MMRREAHPYSGAVYEEVGDGTIRVEDKERGKYGLFNLDGSWIEGTLTSADPHMLQYVGGPNLPPGRDIFWMFLPPSGGEPDVAMTAAPARGGGQDAAQRPKIIGKYVPDPGKQSDDGIRSVSFMELDKLISFERHPDLLPAVYKKTSTLPGGPKKVKTARFFERRYHDLEVEHLWGKVWQMACREEDIPEVGDYIIYTIVNRSYLIVRTTENEIKAHVNACMHRGRSLRECDGKAVDFRCPYHGWRWGIDGSLKDIPSEWDFLGVREDAQQLGSAKVGTWGGFVFINPDPDCISLEDYMGPEMIEHYAKIKLENRYRQAWVGRVVKANWKVVQEGFLEAYHSIATHPQLLTAGGDLTDSRYDVFGNWGRLGHAMPSSSSPTRGMIASEEQLREGWYRSADMMRGYLKSIIGAEADMFSDMELNESTYSNLFPNFSPWSGWGRIVYRFRPNGDNPDECLEEIMLLAPWPEGKAKPAPAPLRMLEPDQSWTDATELGSLGRIIDQDCRNFPNVQNGLKTKTPDHIWYSAYQESIIRNFHNLYEKALGLADGE